MSMIEFNKLMTHDVNLKKIELDYKNAKTVLSSQSLKGFVQYGNKMIRAERGDRAGEDVVSTAIVFLKDDAVIDIEWENWEVDQTAPQTRSSLEVVKIDPIDDPRTGLTHHWELAVL